jgi:hypothetical protein
MVKVARDLAVQASDSCAEARVLQLVGELAGLLSI